MIDNLCDKISDPKIKNILQELLIKKRYKLDDENIVDGFRSSYFHLAI